MKLIAPSILSADFSRLAEEIKAVEAAAIRKRVGLTVRTITPAVYLTGNYRSSSSAKAKELTDLVQGLLAYGVWKSAKDAAASGVPAGTFIIVDDPSTPEQDFTVQIVPAFRRDKRLEPKDPIVKA